MSEFKCECGKTFETKLGLGVHKSFCAPARAKIPAEAFRGGPSRKPERDPRTEAYRERVREAIVERWPQVTEVALTQYQGDWYVEVWRGHVANVGPVVALGLGIEAP